MKLTSNPRPPWLVSVYATNTKTTLNAAAINPKAKLDNETARIIGIVRRTRRGKGFEPISELSGVSATAEEEDEATGVRDKGAVTARSTLEVAFSLRLAGRV